MLSICISRLLREIKEIKRDVDLFLRLFLLDSIAETLITI